MSLKKYKKNLDYSYTFGMFPTIELLKAKPQLVKTVLLSADAKKSKKYSELVTLCNQHGINYDLAPRAIAKIATKENTYAIGVFEKYVCGLDKNVNHVVLVTPMNMGNVGTIIRTMIGFNVKNLAIISPAVDIFDPKIVRSTMGALFKVNFKYFESFEDYKKEFGENNFYPFMLSGDNTLKKTVFKHPASLIFGNEGAGLEDSFSLVGDSVVIKHSNEIDSLNLSVSVSLGLFNL